MLRSTNGTHAANVNSALTMLDATLNRLRPSMVNVLYDLYELLFMPENMDEDRSTLNIIFPSMENHKFTRPDEKWNAYV